MVFLVETSNIFCNNLTRIKKFSKNMQLIWMPKITLVETSHTKCNKLAAFWSKILDFNTLFCQVTYKFLVIFVWFCKNLAVFVWFPKNLSCKQIKIDQVYR